jgi:hypothetical protein
LSTPYFDKSAQSRYGPNMLNFSAQVADIVRRNEAKCDALVKASIQDVVEDAQTPVAKGGRMRVDTGFLRASGQMSLTGMPTGPTRNESGAPVAASDANVFATLAGVNAGDTVYYGWTAAYAAAREFHDGFLSGALQKWQQIVNKNAELLK